MLREAQERRNLALLVATAVNSPKDIDTVAPDPQAKRARVEAAADRESESAFESEQWWDS